MKKLPDYEYAKGDYSKYESYDETYHALDPKDMKDMMEWKRWADESRREYELGHGYKTAAMPSRTTSAAFETVRKMTEKFSMSRDAYLSEYISEELVKQAGITDMLGDKNDDPARVRKRDKTRLCDVYGKGVEYDTT